MEILPIEKFPHNILLKESKLEPIVLSEDLQVMLMDFQKRYRGYAMKGTEETKKVLMATSNVIFQAIYDYYVDKEDQAVEINPHEEIPKAEIKEVAEEIKEEIKAEETPEPPKVEAKPESQQQQVPEGGQPVSQPNPEPQKPEETPEEVPTNKNEKALYELHKAGITENISIQKLKEVGFNTGGWGPLGVRGTDWIGKFKLEKGFSDSTYKLITK